MRIRPRIAFAWSTGLLILFLVAGLTWLYLIRASGAPAQECSRRMAGFARLASALCLAWLLFYFYCVWANRATRKHFVAHLVLLALGLVMAFPFYYMATTSFKPIDEVTRIRIQVTPFFFPELSPYRSLVAGVPYFRFMWNSLIVSVLTVGGTVFFCTLAGYAFAKLNFPGRELIFMGMLMTMMVPYSVLLVPGFLLMRDLGWINSYLALIVPALAPPFYIFLARQFIQAIPDDLLDAATIDGCGPFRTYVEIVLPLSRPLVATIAILAFLGSWNNFVWPLIVLIDESKYTLPLGLSLLQGRYTLRENIQMAGAALAIIPVLVAFMILQKQVVQSFSTSGLKE